MADYPSKIKTIINVGGGWATDLGPSFPSSPQGGAITLPFLLRADNVFYELDGAPHKIGGTSKVNSTQITESSTPVAVHGVFDYWRQGTAGSEAQKQVAYAGTKILKHDMDGIWDELKTGLEDNKQPCFEIFNDDLLLATNSAIDVPQSWDQSAGSTSDLAGSPPKFSFMVRHKNRVFAAGVPGFPSRLYYCAAQNAEDWTGGTAGSIDIDPDDGDRITGLASHKNDLIVFKGPNRLSIHRITGSSPTGSDAFARIPFVSGVGSVNHNGIFRVNDDLVFPSPRGLHSLSATAAYGNYIEAFLSHPILSYYQDSLNHTLLDTCWGVNYQARGQAIWTFADASGSVKNVCLALDYRFQPGRWSRWIDYQDANCLAILQTVGRRHKLYAGTADGYLKQLDVANRSIDGSGAYTADVLTPYLNFGTSAMKKTAEAFFLSLLPKGAYSLIFGYTRDTGTEQQVTVSQGGSDVLDDTFILDQSQLSGGQFHTHASEMEGEFREIQFHLTQSVAAQDMEPHFIEFHMTPAGISLEDD